MFNLKEYVDFDILFDSEGKLNKDYANEKGLRMTIYNGKALMRYNKSKLNKDNIKTLGLFRSVIYDIAEKKSYVFHHLKVINMKIFQMNIITMIAFL